MMNTVMITIHELLSLSKSRLSFTVCHFNANINPTTVSHIFHSYFDINAPLWSNSIFLNQAHFERLINFLKDLRGNWLDQCVLGKRRWTLTAWMNVLFSTRPGSQLDLIRDQSSSHAYSRPGSLLSITLLSAMLHPGCDCNRAETPSWTGWKILYCRHGATSILCNRKLSAFWSSSPQ